MLARRLGAGLPLLLVLALPSARPPALADEDPAAAATAVAVITPADARAHVGDEVTVEFVVVAGRKIDDKEICFLNSKNNHRDSDNFTAVIFRTGLARYAADGIEDPSAEFREKRIRVTGVVEERGGQAQIVVASPAQIEVVEGDDQINSGSPVPPEPGQALTERED